MCLLGLEPCCIGKPVKIPLASHHDFLPSRPVQLGHADPPALKKQANNVHRWHFLLTAVGKCSAGRAKSVSPRVHIDQGHRIKITRLGEMEKLMFGSLVTIYGSSTDCLERISNI